VRAEDRRPVTAGFTGPSPRLAWPAVVLVLVSVAFLGLGLRQAWSDAPTYDEPIYISSGLVAIDAHDLRINAEHPPLYKVLAALPVLLAHPLVPPGYRRLSEHSYAARFLRAQKRAGKMRSVVFLSRIVPLLEALGVGLVLFVLGEDLFGPRAGLLAGVLWLADPLTLGLAHLDGVDVPVALAVVLVSWALLLAGRDPRPRRLLLLGVACGLMVLADGDGLVLAAAAIGAVALIARPRRAVWVVGVAAWVTVLLSYAALDPASLLPALVVPTPYADGIRFLYSHDTRPSVAYLLGRRWKGGRWWYWPLSLWAKVPWPTLALFVLGPLAYRSVPDRARREVLVVAAVPAVPLTVVLFAVQRDIGVRYALPVTALLALVASPIAEVPLWSCHRGRRRLRIVLAAGLVVGLASLSAVETVSSAPNSLAWVNPALGPSYQVVANSSGDWGQDLYALQRWAVGRHPLVSYFGTPLAFSAIPGARPLMIRLDGREQSVAPRSVRGWVAVSASDLTEKFWRQLAWLRAYCPVHEIGGTILLYRFVIPPSRVRGPTVPSPLCSGTASRRSGTASRRSGTASRRSGTASRRSGTASPGAGSGASSHGPPRHSGRASTRPATSRAPDRRRALATSRSVLPSARTSSTTRTLRPATAAGSATTSERRS
jgi:4-amino-4-deoxy-L-arabinose transferase-like glycosyltransferase